MTPHPIPWKSPTPAPASAATYHGCPVFAANDPVITRDVAGAAIDPNSAGIIAHIPNGTFYDEGNENFDYRVNLATNATPAHTVGPNGWRTYPVAPPGGPGNTAPGASEPWQTGFVIEPVSDAHAEVLNTQTCVWTETYATTWNGSSLTAYAGQQYVMSKPFYAEYAPTTVAGIPLLGFTDFGEDASLASINHPLGFIAMDAAVYPGSYTGAATSPEGSGTCAALNECLVDGDILRLKASFPCPASGAILALCNQLKNRGITLSDDASAYGLRMGLDANGNDEWSAAGYGAFASSLTPKNFDVILRK